jgi:2,4-dienoyl-CoA reductase-like NADH-dependent reductase (Old Yellow Enzyme family)
LAKCPAAVSKPQQAGLYVRCGTCKYNLRIKVRKSRPMSPLETLCKPLTLANGTVIPNRLVKAAMTEGLADAHNLPGERLETLYRRWSLGGCGVLITGNVQMDKNHLEQAGNVAIDRRPDAQGLKRFQSWAKACKLGGNQVWMQISHGGRQTPKAINPTPKAPSTIGLAVPGDRFGKPIPLTQDEILDLIERFTVAAETAEAAGFDGVQIHGAHGYLISEFLSPRVNQRTDQWGGDLVGRARFLMEIVHKVRSRVSAGFVVSVKLNSADFQKGGFDFEDSQIVAGWLDEAGVDVIEVSGGTYEQPKLLGLEGLEPVFEANVRQSTRARESYFARFAPEIRARLKRASLMITGGFRSVEGMAEALTDDAIDLIGLGRPLCVDPDVAGKMLKGEISRFKAWENILRVGPGVLGPTSSITLIRALNGFASQGWYYEQLVRLGEGRDADPNMGVLGAFIRNQSREAKTLKALVRDS